MIVWAKNNFFLKKSLQSYTNLISKVWIAYRDESWKVKELCFALSSEDSEEQLKVEPNVLFDWSNDWGPSQR